MLVVTVSSRACFGGHRPEMGQGGPDDHDWGLDILGCANPVRWKMLNVPVERASRSASWFPLLKKKFKQGVDLPSVPA